MNGKIKILALLLILPLLTVIVTIMPQADAEKGDGKSCPNKDKSMKGTSYAKNYSKLAIKTIQKQQI